MAISLKNIFPTTLFGRSLMILVTPVLLIQVITAVVFFDRHWDKVTERLATAVAGEIAIIASQIEKEPDNIDLIKDITSYSIQNLNFIISYQNDVLIEDLVQSKEDVPSIVLDSLNEAIDKKVRRPARTFVDLEEKWIEVFVQLDQGTLQVSLPERRLFSSSSYIFLLWMIFSAIILLTIAVIFMRNQIRPIRRLAVVAERFGKGQDVPKNFRPEGAREVRRASIAFLDMHRRIKRQLEQRTLMLAGVSHDLRTPLTRMKLQVAMLEKSPDLEDLEKDINDMEKMIDAYLEFVRGQGDEQTERINLTEKLDELVKRIEKNNFPIEADLKPDISILARPVALERALNNVLNNARKYANKAWLKLSSDEYYISVEVHDNGPGIKPEKIEDVFKPFFRLEESRNQKTGGVGLGLPIAQDIISSHGGTIELLPGEQGGLCVKIRLPL